MSRSRRYLRYGMLRALFIAAVFVGLGGTSLASEHPIWWDDALFEGDRGHYEVLDYDEMRQVLEDCEAIVIDVRPDYEYERGHIPGAVNFEFHPGDAINLSPRKLEAFKKLLGPDKGRPLVVYCRNFR
jgi:rhodanese-related sulfurtransferase